jgi:putative tryptophan/tyrosine transport system substrate-binding protein
MTRVSVETPTNAGGRDLSHDDRVSAAPDEVLAVRRLRDRKDGRRPQRTAPNRHLVLETRETRGDLKAVEVAARDLERGKVTLICTAATSVTLAAKRATTQTPIVFFAGSDPVTAGLVEGFAKSGGRLTGVYNRLLDLTGKRLEILKEMIPKLARVVTFYDPGNTVAQEGARLGRQAAQQLGVQLIERRVSSIEELRVSPQELKPREVDAYFYTPDAMVGSQSQLVIDAAKAKRWPTMFHEVGRVAKGALASYGYNYREAGRMSAKYVQRILAGAQPKDLPVEGYDKIEFALNRRTAREIGFMIAPLLLLRADQVVE